MKMKIMYGVALFIGLTCAVGCAVDRCRVTNIVIEDNKCNCPYCSCNQGDDCACTKDKCLKHYCKCNKWKK